MPDAVYVKGAFARIANRYVLTNHVLSGGLDILWRKRVTALVKRLNPQRILDVASGTGDLALEMQIQCPGCEIIASDFCPEMLAHATARGVSKTLVADALNLPFENASFDVITVAFGLRNMADYPTALREMNRVIRPGGTLVILDFSLPKGPLKSFYRWYLHRCLPPLAGLLTGEKDAYEYLGGSIEKFPSGQEMIRLLESTGFAEATSTSLTLGIVSIYQATQPLQQTTAARMDRDFTSTIAT